VSNGKQVDLGPFPMKCKLKMKPVRGTYHPGATGLRSVLGRTSSARVGGRSPNHSASQRVYQVMVLELWPGIKMIGAISACGMASVINSISWVDGGKGILY
jgi:hypothetical protein